MTATPVPPSGPNYSMQRAGNGYAVASLILSLIGFCLWFVGGLLGIILGIMGLKRSRTTGTGKGLAMAGIIIGVLSVLFSAGGTTMTVMGYLKAKDLMKGPQAAVSTYLTDLSKNDIDGALSQTSNITKEGAAAQSVVVQSYGGFKEFAKPPIASAANNVVKLNGPATFGVGQKNVDAEVTLEGVKWKITYIKIE